ncbi:MAG: helix-turn-helix domain-containing protein [Planctomycetota bacterium]
MNYHPRVPAAPPLAGSIEVIFHLTGYAPEHGVERLVPNGRTTLVIELDGRLRYIYDNETRATRQVCGGAWLSGVHTRYLTIGDTRPESRLAVVQFVPGRALPFVHQELSEFNDRVVPAAQVFGLSVAELRTRLVTAEDPEPVLTQLEHWLESRYDPSLAPPAAIGTAIAALLDDPGDVALTRLVEDECGISYKHFVHLFKKHVGPNPKTMQRILRFSRVFEMVQGQQRVDWASISLELGYADQAHFIRDFRAFSGYRPRGFAQQRHDRLNFFPDDDPPDDR